MSVVDGNIDLALKNLDIHFPIDDNSLSKINYVIKMFRNYIPGNQTQKVVSIDPNLSFEEFNNISTNPYKMQFSINSKAQKVLNKIDDISITNEVSLHIHSNRCSINCFYCYKKDNILNNLSQEISRLNENCNLLIELLINKSKLNIV